MRHERKSWVLRARRSNSRAKVAGMRSLSINDLSVGLSVLYAGGQDEGDVLDPERRRLGHVLMPHHPGVIREVQNRHHIQVSFRGLEEEPVSWGVGFGYDESTGIYPGLLVPDANEWERASHAGWWSRTQ
jgi:hypothetical protein